MNEDNPFALRQSLPKIGLDFQSKNGHTDVFIPLRLASYNLGIADHPWLLLEKSMEHVKEEPRPLKDTTIFIYEYPSSILIRE